MTVVIALAIVIALPVHQAEAACPFKTLSNFDLLNFTDQNASGMDLTLRGNGLTCAHISSYYSGWGTVWDGTKWVPRGGCQDLGGGRIRITWSDPNNPILPSEYRHFGLSYKAGTPDVRAEAAYWTSNRAVIGAISEDEQWWIWDDNTKSYTDVIVPVDVTPLAPDPGPPWGINRASAVTSQVIPLDSLTQNNPMVTSLLWTELPPDTLYGDGDSLVLVTNPLPEHGAAVVKYSVYSGGLKLAVFINEATLETEEAIPTLTEWGLIIFGVLLLGFITCVFLRRRKVVVARL